MHVIDRRDFLTRLSLVTSAILVPPYAFSSTGRSAQFAEVEITHGRIRGVRGEGVNVLKGYRMEAESPGTVGFVARQR